jgi:hypothetical protein
LEVSHVIFSVHLMIILSAPRGVTRMAGANAYAAKLAISPTITDGHKRSCQKICQTFFVLKISVNQMFS